MPDIPRDRHVRRSGDDYATQFLTLLPTGQAWPREPGSTLVLTCDGLNQFWGHVDSRAADLLEIDSDPGKTLPPIAPIDFGVPLPDPVAPSGLLPDWERNWGLPEKCLAEPQTIEERHIALVNKMRMLGAQSRQFFIDLAKSIGYDITIEEYSPFMTGISRCGYTSDFDPLGRVHYSVTGHGTATFNGVAQANPLGITITPTSTVGTATIAVSVSGGGLTGYTAVGSATITTAGSGGGLAIASAAGSAAIMTTESGSVCGLATVAGTGSAAATLTATGAGVSTITSTQGAIAGGAGLMFATTTIGEGAMIGDVFAGG